MEDSRLFWSIDEGTFHLFDNVISDLDDLEDKGIVLMREGYFCTY